MTYAILHLHLEKWSELHKYVVINILEWCTRNALNNAAVALFYSCKIMFLINFYSRKFLSENFENENTLSEIICVK